jgi:TonB-dependent receptor
MKKKLRFTFKNSQILLRFLFSLSLFFLTTMIMYGEGLVRGVITESDGTPLIAATVAVKGTTKGVITDFNGAYSIAYKAGTYTLQVSYVGFEPKEDTVTITDNKITTLNISLSSISILGEEVIVTAQARGQMAALNQQLRSNQVVNVVSAERIRELPDENAAQAISRLPGITLDGSKVVIRGIESKMNKIMINGIEMPSTEGTNRSTDLGIVSANMLSGIEVFKTLTPDMDADAIGGVVNLRMRSAPNGFHTSMTLQGGYNSQEALIGKKMVWGDISNRFFNNKFGVLLNLNYEARQGGDDWITADYGEQGTHPIGHPDVKYQFTGVNVYDQQKTTMNYGGSLVLDYKLPKGQLVFTSMLSHTTPETTQYRDDMEPLNSVNYHYFYVNHDKNNSMLLNNSLRLEQQIGITKLDASVSLVSMDRVDDYRYQVRFKDNTIAPFQKELTKDPDMLVMEPWQVYNIITPGAIEAMRIFDAQLNPNQFSENQILADLNLQIPLKISNSIDINFRLGGKYNKKNREYNQDYLQYTEISVAPMNAKLAPWFAEKGINYIPGAYPYFSDFRDENYKTNKSFMNNSPYYNMDYVADVDLLDEMFLEQFTEQVNLDPSIAKACETGSVARADYWGTETKLAGYVMAEINLGKKITIIPGVRYESMNNNFSAYKTVDVNKTFWEIRDTLNSNLTNVHLFPHLHARFRATDWWDIRFSYNQTISRPDYNNLIPMVYVNETAGSGEAGSPDIRPAVSENFDANFTFFTSNMGLITIGGYMKTIDDIFYKQATQIKNLPDSTLSAQFPKSMQGNQIDYYLNSPFAAYVKGLEVEWQSNFSWLPAPFNGIVLNANYSHVWSETTYMQNRILYVKPPGGLVKLPVESDTSFVNRLLNQGNDIANVSLGYDNKGFSARLSFRFQGNVISQIGSRLEENEYTNNVYAYDFVVKQKIPLKFADFEVFFNAINFTNVPQMRYSIYPNKGETNTYTRYSGAQFQLGLRLKH